MFKDEERRKQRRNKYYSKFKGKWSKRAPKLDDTRDSPDTDAGAGYLRSLAAITRNDVFRNHGTKITAQQFRDIELSIMESNLEVYPNITNRLVPYLPNTKYCVQSKACKLTSTSSLLSLAIDAPSLFSIFTDKTKEESLDLFSCKGNKITSLIAATAEKDAVFNSFFNLEKIKALLGTHKLQFGHRMTLEPKNSKKKSQVPPQIC
ncbi:hypothetical protein [Parasitella parasitica]|uniref:Uncharacterized protein n=1 Tax=Parasitella parasitica TaxID=35722 RepID=A0A0B7MWV9_9FUNG|nr:hypothetical protein [Parasitella parasitica]